MQNHSEQEIRQYAGFWIRFTAHMVDLIIVSAVLFIIGIFMEPVMELMEDTMFGGELIFQYTLTDIIEYIFATAYFIILTYFTGATLGKKLLKLRVISVKDDGKLKLFDVVYRETIGRYLSDALGGIGYLTVAFTDEKKAIHDMLCDTRVVEVKTKRVAPVRTVVNPVSSSVSNPEVNPTMQNEGTQEDDLAGNMVPQMVTEPPKQGNSCIEEQVQEQWQQILNPQKEETTPPCEEQNIEGNS